MDFEPENIVEDKYWTFGMFAKKDGTIDYKQLLDDLRTMSVCIAAISLETADGIYYARLVQKLGYRWIFENTKNPSDNPVEYFKDFTSGSVFENFAENVPQIMKRGFDALENILKTNPEEFKKNGINEGQIKNLISISASILKKTDEAFSKPVLKR